MKTVKKASLSLSVNAIVILILAIVMLGLGLGCIKGMFGKVSLQLEQQVSAEPIPQIPTGNEPITLSRETLVSTAGSKEVIKVSVLNPTDTIWNNAKPIIDCSSDFQVADQKVNPRDLAQGKFFTFALLVGVPQVPANTYLCKISVEGQPKYSKDLTIRVTQ